MSPQGRSHVSSMELGQHSITFTEDDAILYALAVGAGADELELVDERRLEVLPTMALTWGLWAADRVGELGGFDALRSVHASQELVLHEPLPRHGRIDMEADVRAVWDKGSAAIIEIGVASHWFDAVYSIYAPGSGGFGGERGPTAATEVPAAPRTNYRVTAATHRDQAALYRLTGDHHRIHIDPEAARAVGSDRPILHGLCTLAVAVRAVARATDTSATRLRALSARFSGIVIPGEELVVDVDELADRSVAFTAHVDGRSVLRDGAARFAPGATSTR